MFSGYRVAFDSACLWRFGKDFARNTIICDVDNISSSRTENSRIFLWCLGEGLTHDINYSIGSAELKYIINFSKARTKYCLSLHYNCDNNCLLMVKKSISLKVMIKMLTLQLSNS